MRIITVNLNGIRSAAKAGFFVWLAKQDADVVCIQETKAQEWQLPTSEFIPEGYSAYFFDAEKKGYSGVAIYTRHKPQKVIKGLNFALADSEGRYIQVDFPHTSIASVYFPSGTTGPERQACKYEFMAAFEKHIKQINKQHQKQPSREYILCGDWNIAHTKNDIKNWRGNQKNSGFLPEERAWLDLVFGKLALVDAFRVLNQEPDQYTWWSNRGQAYAKNVGWRIDYQIITPGLKPHVKAVAIYKDQRFSDHAPLIIDYDWRL